MSPNPERAAHEAALAAFEAWRRRLALSDEPVPLRLVGRFAIAWPGGIVDATEWHARLSPVATYTHFIWTGRN